MSIGLESKDVNILQLSYGAPGCVYYRNLNPGEVFNQNGWSSYVVETDMRKQQDLAKGERIIRDWADIVVVTRFSDWTPYLNMARRFGKRVVYEIDDTPVLHAAHPSYKMADQNNWFERVKVQAEHADAVTCSTEMLADFMRQFHDHVFVIPNMIDYGLPMWNRKSDRSDSRSVIGYFGGSSHLPDLKAVEPAITHAVKNYPHVDWWYGAIPNREYVRRYNDETGEMKVDERAGRAVLQAKRLRRLYNHIKRKRIKYLYPLDIKEYGGVYRDFDITVAPLTNDGFNRYKSNLKLLEAGAYYLPVVAANLEPFRDDIIACNGGILAATPEEYKDGIVALLKNPDEAAAMGRRLGEYVRDQYDLFSHQQAVLDVYRGIMEIEPQPRDRLAPRIPSKPEEKSREYQARLMQQSHEERMRKYAPLEGKARLRNPAQV